MCIDRINGVKVQQKGWNELITSIYEEDVKSNSEKI